ncbi:MAG: bacterioferritin [Hyphomicrobiales bacterium]|nr:bacterioferritin [Hyphomicrobiales bacterium]
MARKTDKTMIKHLNTILRNELTAINQYFLHSKILKNDGYSKLAEKEYEESIDEMKHASELSERILFLGGLPNLQDMGKLSVGENPKEMLTADHATEINAVEDLRAPMSMPKKPGFWNGGTAGTYPDL